MKYEDIKKIANVNLLMQDPGAPDPKTEDDDEEDKGSEN